MRVALRPSEPGDFIELLGRLPEQRVRALTATVDGKILGLGGFLLMPDKTVWCSCVISDEGRKFPAAVHRAGVLVMRQARAWGFRRVYAKADADLAGADRWLERLGFVRDRGGVFVWQA